MMRTCRGQGSDDFLRGAVGQAAEHRVEPAPVDLFPFHQFRRVAA